MSPTRFPTQEVTVRQVPVPQVMSPHGMGVGVVVGVGVSPQPQHIGLPGWPDAHAA